MIVAPPPPAPRPSSRSRRRLRRARRRSASASRRRGCSTTRGSSASACATSATSPRGTSCATRTSARSSTPGWRPRGPRAAASCSGSSTPCGPSGRAHAADAAAVRARVPPHPGALSRRARLDRVERGQPPVLAHRQPAAARRAVLRRGGVELPRLPDRRRRRARRERHDRVGAALPAPRVHRPRIWGLHNYVDANRFTSAGTRALLRSDAREGVVHRDGRPGDAARVRGDDGDARVPLLAAPRGAGDRARPPARAASARASGASTSTTGARRRP